MFVVKTSIYSVYTLTLIKLTFLAIVYGVYVTSVSIRDILLISMTVRPEWKILREYLGSTLIIPDLRPVKVFISSVNVKCKNDSCGIIRFPRASECRIIRAERIKKLQSVIIKKLLGSWFGIKCKSDDLEVLSSFGNTGWLTHNLLLASGIKKRNYVAMNIDSRRKVQTVYRSFVSSLALYLKLEENIRNGSAKLPKSSFMAKICVLLKKHKPNSVVTKNMYPKEIDIQSLKIRRQNILSYKLEAVRQIKVNSEYLGFEKYLKAQSLIMEGRIQNREKVEILMNKLESLH